MSTGRVRFVGCGPGAADLLTLRAVGAIAAADVIVWNPVLLDEAVLGEHARPGAAILRWPPATQTDILAVYDRAAAEGLQVVRLKGGDPTLFGQLGDELDAVRARGLRHDIVPGVSPVTAGAAALACEIGGAAAPLLLLAAGAPTRAPGAIAVLNAGRDGAAIADDLAARGLDPDSPCALLVGISRPEQIVETCRLSELAETMGDFGTAGLTIVLAGPAIAAAESAGGADVAR